MSFFFPETARKVGLRCSVFEEKHDWPGWSQAVQSGNCAGKGPRVGRKAVPGEKFMLTGGDEPTEGFA